MGWAPSGSKAGQPSCGLPRRSLDSWAASAAVAARTRPLPAPWSTKQARIFIVVMPAAGWQKSHKTWACKKSLKCLMSQKSYSDAECQVGMAKSDPSQTPTLLLLPALMERLGSLHRPLGPDTTSAHPFSQRNPQPTLHPPKSGHFSSWARGSGLCCSTPIQELHLMRQMIPCQHLMLCTLCPCNWPHLITSQKPSSYFLNCCSAGHH